MHHDDLTRDEFDMEAAARAIAAALGTTAYVEHTGGNCATIYIGNDPTTHELPTLTVGPGTFHDRAMSSLEAYIGLDADRFGEIAHDHAETMPEWHDDPVSWLVDRARDLWAVAATLPVEHETWDAL